MVPFSFHSTEMFLIDCGGATRASALYWPCENALLVADLHLEKGSFYAGTGQFLPPYDSRETLERLTLAIKATGARRVFALGDNFHDSTGPDRLEFHARDMLHSLIRTMDWVWITGNHDSHLSDAAGGTRFEELTLNNITLRHQAMPGYPLPEISGHFHPKLILHAKGRRISRACFVHGASRLILPAFGALTGGMDAASPIIVAALQPAVAIEAIIPVKRQLLRYPLWQKAT